MKSSLAQLIGIHTEERAWRMGRIGEEKVAAQLAKLVRKDPRWRVPHSVAVGSRGADIDHVVIGPGGVFTVNAKHHPGADIWVSGNTVKVDGYGTSYVRESRREADRAGKLLSAACGSAVPVEGMIVMVKAHDFVDQSQPVGVHVMTRGQLVDRLRRFGQVLDEARIQAIFDVARRSTTWR